MESALNEAQETRRRLGVDPSRLLVLGMNLIDADGRRELERMGLQIIDEQQVRRPVDPPYYEVLRLFRTV